MMSSERYVIDNTVIEDYYVNKDPNVKKWVNQIYSQSEDKILILPTVLLEFIRRSHYYRQEKPELINILLDHLKGLGAVEILLQNDKSIKKLAANLDCISNVAASEIDLGEFSLSQEIHFKNTVIVTSDKRALSAFKNNIRMNPRLDPPTMLQIGEEYS